MAAESDIVARLLDAREEIILPMIKQRRFAELNEKMTALLAGERDDDLRPLLMGELSASLRLAGEKVFSLAWATRITEEFGDRPLAWTDLARWYWFGSPTEPMTRQNMLIALTHYETALQRAWAADENVRYILFDTCRLLTDLEDYPRLEAAMRDILDDLKNRRAHDIPRIEGEWLKRVPDEALDPDLVGRYRRIMAADRARMPHLGYRIHPATLDELED